MASADYLKRYLSKEKDDEGQRQRKKVSEVR
jgi:hypothetical protein